MPALEETIKNRGIAAIDASLKGTRIKDYWKVKNNSRVHAKIVYSSKWSINTVKLAERIVLLHF